MAAGLKLLELKKLRNISGRDGCIDSDAPVSDHRAGRRLEYEPGTIAEHCKIVLAIAVVVARCRAISRISPVDDLNRIVRTAKHIPVAFRWTKNCDVVFSVPVIVGFDWFVAGNTPAKDQWPGRGTEYEPLAVRWTKHGYVSLAVTVVVALDRNIGRVAPGRDRRSVIRASEHEPQSCRRPIDCFIRLPIAVVISGDGFVSSNPKRDDIRR